MGEDLSTQEPTIDVNNSEHGSAQEQDSPTLLHETIGYNNVVAVPLHNGRRLEYMGGELVAKLKLGGTKGSPGEEAFPSQELDFYSIQLVDDSDYKRLVKNALKERSTSRVVVVRPPDETQLGAIGFIPETHPSTIGRESSIQWYDLGSFRPLEQNVHLFYRSVSRRQLAVHIRDEQLIFIGATQAPEGYLDSVTEIEAPKITKFGS